MEKLLNKLAPLLFLLTSCSQVNGTKVNNSSCVYLDTIPDNGTQVMRCSYPHETCVIARARAGVAITCQFGM